MEMSKDGESSALAKPRCLEILPRPRTVVRVTLAMQPLLYPRVKAAGQQWGRTKLKSGRPGQTARVII